MIVVDSSVWIDAIRGADTPQVTLLRKLDVDGIAVLDVVVFEVLRGFRTEAEAALHEAGFQAIGIVSASSAALATAAAANYRLLRARGITIRSALDVLIATYCIESGLRLLHDDRDFDHFERHLGLAVARP